MARPPRSKGVNIVFLFYHFRGHSVSKVTVFIQLVQDVGTVQGERTVTDVDAATRTVPRAPPRAPSRPSVPVSDAIGAMPHSNVHSIFSHTLTSSTSRLHRNLHQLHAFTRRV